MKGKNHSHFQVSLKINFSMSRQVLILILMLSLSEVYGKRRKNKDTGCDFCNEHLRKSSDESG